MRRRYTKATAAFQHECNVRYEQECERARERDMIRLAGIAQLCGDAVALQRDEWEKMHRDLKAAYDAPGVTMSTACDIINRTKDEWLARWPYFDFSNGRWPVHISNAFECSILVTDEHMAQLRQSDFDYHDLPELETRWQQWAALEGGK